MFEDRLDPALRQFAAARTDLSASVLGVVRDSLNQRRGEASRDVNTVGVEIESREAGSIPVRIYRGGRTGACTGGDLLPLRGFCARQPRHRSPAVCRVR
jgi:acetyl esterase